MCQSENWWSKGLTLYQMKIFLDWSKLKELADNKKSVTGEFKFVLGQVENTGKKKKMLFTSIFSFFHNVFKSFLFQSLNLKVGIVW